MPDEESQWQSVSQPAPDLPLEQPQQQADPLDSIKASLAQRYQQLQPKPASGGPVRQLLQNFFADTGKFFMGDQRAHQQEQVLRDLTTVSNVQGLDQWRKAQSDQFEMVDVPLPNGTTGQLPKKFIGQWMAAQQGNQLKRDLAAQSLESKETIANNAIQAKKDLTGLTGTPITQELATKYGLPADFIGKIMKLSDAAGAQNAQSRQAMAKAIVQRTNLAQATFDRDTFGTVFGKDVPSSLVDIEGNTIGWKSPSSPTSSIKTQAQQSQDLTKLFTGIRQEIDKAEAAGMLGPGPGRVNEIMTGRVGADNPEFAKLRVLMSMSASGALKAHFGARGATQIYDEFKNKLDAGKMTAGDLKGAMSGFQTFFDEYAKRAQTAGSKGKTENWVRVNGKLVKQ